MPTSSRHELRDTNSKEQHASPQLSSVASFHCATIGTRKCIFCSSTHNAASCSSHSITLEKKVHLSEEARCFRCLTLGHLARQCKKKIACQHCSRRHASSMCIQYQRGEVNEHVTTTPVQLMSINQRSVVLLPTLANNVSGSTRALNCRVLLDGGSQRSFITTGVARKLGCELVGQETLTVGVNRGKGIRRDLQ